MESGISFCKYTKLSALAGIGLMAGVMLALSGCSSGGDGIAETCNVPQEASLTTSERIGGATSSVKTFTVDGTEWSVFNLANELKTTKVDTLKREEYSVEVGGFIKDIEIVTMDGERYALLAMGDEGISVVNITDPTNPTLTTSVKVNYEQTGITWTEGGGDIVPDNTISSSRAPISSLVVYDDGDVNTPLELIIGDEGYGLHKTALSNLFDETNGREADGSLKIDSEIYTLQYAGENPWGGPKSMTLFGSGAGQRLFVAQGFMGMGIYDPATLEKVGQYSLYTDETENNHGEDWFIDKKVSAEVQGPTYVDTCTGMPNYNQANFEIQQVWHGDVVASTPWADFDRYGKYYYDARKVAVQTFTGAGPDKTIAYIAYGLAGMVAVDVTGYETSGARNDVCSANLDAGKPFLNGSYLGYAPAVPAHGPEDPTGEESKSLFPYFGVGMLKEAGTVDVEVDATNNQVYFSDHFAGLMVMDNADDPSKWHGTNGAGAYDNDTDGTLGNHWPDYEFITSYDMTPVPNEEEEIPAYIYESPILLATGEVSGHGNNFALTDGFSPTNDGGIDVALTAGGGGLNFIEMINISSVPSESEYRVWVHFATTDEIGAAADGTATQEINIGHSEGVTAYGNLLFLADGPHGMSVWKIADDDCNAIDDVHLVANTLQDEYPVTLGAETINPAPHAYDVVVDSANESVLVMSQSKGVRRVDSGVEGEVGAPVLLYPQPTDIFEHNTDGGNVAGLSMQDHAYGVALKGTLAFTADGSNGLTVYDLSKDPTTEASGYVVGNIGGDTVSQPPLGQAHSVALWDDSESGKSYAFVAAGSRGVGVVDVTDPTNMSLVKVFEPIKIEDETVGKADGKSVVVRLVGDYAIFTYDSFGVVEYRISDLISPLPDPLPSGITPTKIWKKNGEDYRPEVTARFKLQDPTFFGSADMADLSGGAAGMDIVQVDGKTLVYVAYGDAGVIKIDWTNPSAPALMEHINTVGSALDVVVINGRAYVADSGGGLTLIK